MKKAYTTEQFISICDKVHNNFYDYSLVNYKLSSEKIKIICPLHGEFIQQASSHRKGTGCPSCAGNAPLTVTTFLNKAINIHNNKYSYCNLNIVSHETIIDIICPIHGKFSQTINSHLSGKGCIDCANITIGLKNTKPMDEFIEKSSLIHNNKFSYEKVQYKTLSDEITINCLEHGYFTQVAAYHITGRVGCGECNKALSSKAVREIEQYLKDTNVKYIREYKFDECKYINTLPFDFFLPEINTCIEYDGEQHFMIKEHWGGMESFNLIQIRDKIKTTFCLNNNIKLVRISYKENHIEIIKKLLRR